MTVVSLLLVESLSRWWTTNPNPIRRIPTTGKVQQALPTSSRDDATLAGWESVLKYSMDLSREIKIDFHSAKQSRPMAQTVTNCTWNISPLTVAMSSSVLSPLLPDALPFCCWCWCSLKPVGFLFHFKRKTVNRFVSLSVGWQKLTRGLFVYRPSSVSIGNVSDFLLLLAAIHILLAVVEKT